MTDILEVNELAAEIARDRAAGLAQLPDDERDAVQRIIGRGIDQGWSDSQLQDRIADAIGLTPRYALAVENFRDNLLAQNTPPGRADSLAKSYAIRLRNHRALMIARTEVMKALNDAQREIWVEKQESGEISRWAVRVFRVHKDERLCRVCRPLNGRRAGLTSEVPGPPLHPSCRCTEELVDEGILKAEGYRELWWDGITKHRPGTHEQLDHGNRYSGIKALKSMEEFLQWKGDDDVIYAWHGTRSSSIKNIYTRGLKDYRTPGRKSALIYMTTDRAEAIKWSNIAGGRSGSVVPVAVKRGAGVSVEDDWVILSGDPDVARVLPWSDLSKHRPGLHDQKSHINHRYLKPGDIRQYIWESATPRNLERIRRAMRRRKVKPPPVADMETILRDMIGRKVEKHRGPGPHRSGTPQSVHGNRKYRRLLHVTRNHRADSILRDGLKTDSGQVEFGWHTGTIFLTTTKKSAMEWAKAMGERPGGAKSYTVLRVKLPTGMGDAVEDMGDLLPGMNQVKVYGDIAPEHISMAGRIKLKTRPNILFTRPDGRLDVRSKLLATWEDISKGLTTFFIVVADDEEIDKSGTTQTPNRRLMRMLSNEFIHRDLVSKGDKPGHPFRGNQWVSGSGGNTEELADRRYRPKTAQGNKAMRSLERQTSGMPVHRWGEAMRTIDSACKRIDRIKGKNTLAGRSKTVAIVASAAKKLRSLKETSV